MKNTLKALDNLNTSRNDRKLHKREVNHNRKINTMPHIYIHSIFKHKIYGHIV